ncbi:MAG: Rrf2 family transcriptional regulator [Hyphomicrobiaceae bacterium]|nr:Rrf2 family transcriptional regulator [Hyphomicrobiaceae bacterium]
MRLNKVTTHAIRVLVACANAGEALTKVADLADKLDLTPQNTFKVVHLLSRAGLVEATRGRYGGVKLARTPETIPIGDVVRAMEAVSVDTEDGTPGDDRSDERRFELFDDAFEAFLRVLDNTSIADMARADKVKSKARAASARPVPAAIAKQKKTKVTKSATVRQPRRTSQSA